MKNTAGLMFSSPPIFINLPKFRAKSQNETGKIVWINITLMSSDKNKTQS